MNMIQRKLLTIVAEASLEKRLIKLLTDNGCQGYTVLTGHGSGPKNQRVADLEGGNVIIETVLKDEILDPILHALEQDYFKNYACTVWISQVEVIRGERY